jgi:hypothetical protein
MDAQKPDNGARLSHNPRKNFFLSVNYLTLPNRFPEGCCLRVGGSGRSGKCQLIRPDAVRAL